MTLVCLKFGFSARFVAVWRQKIVLDLRVRTGVKFGVAKQQLRALSAITFGLDAQIDFSRLMPEYERKPPLKKRFVEKLNEKSVQNLSSLASLITRR